MHYALLFVAFLSGILACAFVLAGLFNPAVGRVATIVFYVVGAALATLSVYAFNHL